MMHAGHHRQQGKGQQQAIGQSRAEHPRLVLAPQFGELHQHQAEQANHHRPVQAQQQRVVAREEAGVGGGGGEQEQQDSGERRTADDQNLHFASAPGGVKSKANQSVPRLQSLLPKAVTCSGLGNCAKSRRMRTPAR